MCCFTLGLNWMIQYSAKLESHLSLLFVKIVFCREACSNSCLLLSLCGRQQPSLQLQSSRLPVTAAAAQLPVGEAAAVAHCLVACTASGTA